MSTDIQQQALADIIGERARQDKKWGEQNLDPITYLAVLTEEVGELAEAALHSRFGGVAAWSLRTEAVHTAAVALAIVECIDRGLWQWPVAAADYAALQRERDALAAQLAELQRTGEKATNE